MKKIVLFCCLLGVIAAGWFLISSQFSKDDKRDALALYLLVGSYASPTQEGVKLYRFDDSTGDATYLSGMKGISNPSYLVPSVEGSRIYAVEEVAGDTASVYTLFFDKDASHLSVLNRQNTQGAEPCYVTMNPSCQFVVTANYSGANISVFSLDIDGKLKPEPTVIPFTGRGPVASRQLAPHPHFVAFTPDQKYLLVNDLGTDRIHILPLTSYVSTGMAQSLLDVDNQTNLPLDPGSGPRHLDFHPNGKWVYLLNELSGMVTVLGYQGGNLWKKQTIAADELGAQGAADIHVSRDGKFVFASVRLKNDGIAIFSVDAETGLLTKVGYQHTGQHPRNFVLSPSGDFLLVACRDSNTIQVFKVDKSTGLLTDTGKTITTNRPSCLQFVR
jgi:6-phosphogluconolactonase (cycloisomerase 2 family)